METKCGNNRCSNSHGAHWHLSFSPVPELFFTDQFFGSAIIKPDPAW